jgi:hypothetical protein
MSRVIRGRIGEMTTMRRWVVSAGVVVAAAGPLTAQIVFTLNDLDKAMKGVGRNVALVDTAIASKDFETAKERIARARELLTPTLSFWRNEGRSDAQQMARAATARLDDLDALLSVSPVDRGQVGAAVALVEAACQACHAVYREEDPSTRTFRLKPLSTGATDRR